MQILLILALLAALCAAAHAQPQFQVDKFTQKKASEPKKVKKASKGNRPEKMRGKEKTEDQAAEEAIPLQNDEELAKF